MQEKEIGTLERLSCVQHATKKFVGAQRIAGCQIQSPQRRWRCGPMAVMVRCTDCYVVRQMRDDPGLFIDQMCRRCVRSFTERKVVGFELVSNSQEIEQGQFSNHVRSTFKVH